MLYSLLDWSVILGRPSPIVLLNLQVKKGAEWVAAMLHLQGTCPGFSPPHSFSWFSQLNNQPSPSALQFELGKQQQLTDFSCWANWVEDVKPVSALSTAVWELQRSSQEADNRPRRKLFFSLHLLPLALLFCLYSADFFTAPHIILSIFCSQQHLLSFPVFLALNSHFSATIFISIVSWPLSCNSFMLLQNLCQALETGPFCLMKDAGLDPVPFSCWRAVWQLGTSVTYSGSWLNGTSDVRKARKDSL